MIDVKRLDGGALIWRARDLVGETADVDEYLAHGPVRGEGFKTAAWKKFTDAGLEKFFPEMGRPIEDKYGSKVREVIFEENIAVAIEESDVDVARAIGALFGNLEMIATVVLLAMRPRVINHCRGKEKYKLLNQLAVQLDKPKELNELANESWLRTCRGVFKESGGQDVVAWMNLLRSVAFVVEFDITD